MGRVTLSRPDSPESLTGDRDRVEHGLSGFRSEKLENGFQFRCVDCNKIVRRTKANRTAPFRGLFKNEKWLATHTRA